MARIFNILTVVSIWLFILFICRKLNMKSFKFLAGSIGLFFIVIFFFEAEIEMILANIITYILDYISQFFKAFSVYPDYSMISMSTHNGWISMDINYECLGVIELVVFSSLLVFFPYFNAKEIVKLLILGNGYLIITNIIRILFIIAVTVIGGVGWFKIAHVILARILYFFFTIVLYYIVFTKNQIKFQKVGDMQ